MEGTLLQNNFLQNEPSTSAPPRGCQTTGLTGGLRRKKSRAFARVRVPSAPLKSPSNPGLFALRKGRFCKKTFLQNEPSTSAPPRGCQTAGLTGGLRRKKSRAFARVRVPSAQQESPGEILDFLRCGRHVFAKIGIIAKSGW